MPREYFKCFHSYKEKTKSLTDAEVGRLFRALMDYSMTGEAPSLAGRESIAFDFIADEIRRDHDAYAQLCRQNAQNRASNTDNDRQRPSTTVDDRPREATEHDEIDKVEGIRYKETIKETHTSVCAKKSSAFHPPTRAEVEEYCKERNNGINAERFLAYYEAQNWKRSNGVKISDWKAAVRYWEQRDKENQPKRNRVTHGYEQHTDIGDVEGMVVNLTE